MDPIFLQAAIQTIGLVGQNQLPIEADLNSLVEYLISSINEHDASKLSECLAEQIYWGDGDVIGDKHAFIKYMNEFWKKHTGYSVKILSIKCFKPENGAWIEIESLKQSNFDLKHLRLICIEKYYISDDFGSNSIKSNNLEIHLGIQNSKIKNISLIVPPRSP